MVVISDASPLVHLSAISRFSLLKELFPALLVPNAVWLEVTDASAGRPGADDLKTAVREGWIRIAIAKSEVMRRVELEGLDLGEKEALAVALDLNAEMVLIDELRGQSVARQMGLTAVGTLGVLIEAKRRGFIPALRPEMTRLLNDTLIHLSPEIEQAALVKAGEA